MNYELPIMNYKMPVGLFKQLIIRNSSFIIIMLVWVIVLSGCSDGPVTGREPGNGSGGESIEVAGLVSNNAGGAIVTMYPRSYNRKIDGLIPDSLVDTTNEEGAYSFENVEPGLYNIEAVSVDGDFNALAQDIEAPDVKDTNIIVPLLKLQAPGDIRVSLTEMGVQEGDYVYIPGTSVSDDISNEDVLQKLMNVSLVPEGVFHEFMYGRGKDSVYNMLNEQMEVKSGSTVVIQPYRSWMYLKKIGINTTGAGANIGNDLAEFPLLIRLNKDNFDFSQAQGKGQDVRFSKEDGTVVPFEIERWDSSAAVAEIWVKIDTVFGNTSKPYVRMYWGAPFVEGESKGGPVFDTANGFAGVWHLAEEGNVLTDGYKDVTAIGVHGKGSGLGDTSDVDGAIGVGQEFDGVNGQIDLGDFTVLNGAEALTVSFWCLADSINFVNIAGVFSRGSSTQRVPRIYGVRGKDYILFRMKTPELDFDGDVHTTSLTQGQWSFVSFTWDGNIVTPFVDAVAGVTDSTEGSVLDDTDGSSSIGDVSNGGNWDGKLDEIRVSKTARSADWVKLNFETQRPGANAVWFEE
ncbi:MAG: DUF2341 domain-containing protein [Fibrobacteria bacterium]|nr:DUF2341 domain-containing protein [Fibrobacteria bacterium]